MQNVHLTDEHVLLILDSLLFCMLQELTAKSGRRHAPGEGFVLPVNLMDPTTQEYIDAIRTLLDKPLRTPDFVRKFRDHFQEHPIEYFRQSVWVFLQRLVKDLL